MRFDPLRSARPGERLPGEVSFPARLTRPLRTAVITGVLLLAGSLALALFQRSAQAWFAVAAAVTLAVAISVILAGRGPLLLSREGLSLRALGRRRTYTWGHIAGFEPRVVAPGAEMVAIEVVDPSQRRQILMETYGYTPAELCAFLWTYRAQALAGDLAT